MNYTISWSFYVQTSTKKKLLEEHWPNITMRWDIALEIDEIEKRENDTGPFHIYATMTIDAPDDRQAVTVCLEKAFKFSGIWTVTAPEFGIDGKLVSFEGSYDGKMKGRSPVVSAGFMLFPAGSQQLLGGGIAMHVQSQNDN